MRRSDKRRFGTGMQSLERRDLMASDLGETLAIRAESAFNITLENLQVESASEFGSWTIIETSNAGRFATNGTLAGTHHLTSSRGRADFFIANDLLLYVAPGNRIFATDAMTGTDLVVESLDSHYHDFVSANDRVYFLEIEEVCSENPENFCENRDVAFAFWSTDGTVEGLRLEQELAEFHAGGGCNEHHYWMRNVNGVAVLFHSYGGACGPAHADFWTSTFGWYRPGDHVHEVYVSDQGNLAVFQEVQVGDSWEDVTLHIDPVSGDVLPGPIQSNGDIQQPDELREVDFTDLESLEQLVRQRIEEGLAGDANRDSAVDFRDFLILSENFACETTYGSFAGDFDGDGTVSFADFLILSANY